ncbi:MAG: mechanosensitive ion channel family protein [Paramuribaculum sp.]|nr:mechanosensitive ion channel family protein [Paramuribaculum sp.]
MNAQIIPSHTVASWLLTNIKHFLDYIGLSHDKTIEEIVYVAIIVGAALLIGWLVRRGILFGARKFVKMRKSPGARLLLQQRVLTKCSHIIPPIVILALLPFAFDSTSRLLVIFEKCLYIYTAIVFAIGLNAVLTFIWTRVDERENTKNLPLKGILNICVGIVWIIVAIVSISVVVDKSPAMLLAGLGVFASALMLVFKDTILGFVAGIQLAENDMLHVGDWIVVPSTIANGIVEDVSLSAVKVRNWDNTIVTLPPYTLISTSFQNWRGMSASGWRQIAREVIFDAYYIKKCDKELIDRVTTLYPEIKGFVEESQKRGKPDYNPGVAVVNGTIETNLGLFRAYMCQYLLNHPLIGTDQQILVRVMTPNGQGIPLQIWCFTTTAWTAYEAVQSEIFEHIAAVCTDFDLQLFNYPSGTDTEIIQMQDPDWQKRIPADVAESASTATATN